MHILSKKQAIYNYNFILFCNFKKLKIINDKGRTVVFLKRGFFVQSIFFHFFSVFFLFVLNITIALLNYFRNV